MFKGKNEYSWVDHYWNLMIYENKSFHQMGYKNEPPRFKALDELKIDPFVGETPGVMLNQTFMTPIGLHFIWNHGPVPHFDVNHDYTLYVGGDVKRSMSLTLEDILYKYRPHKIICTLQCASNRSKQIGGGPIWGLNGGVGLVGTAKWTGVRLCEILEHVQLLDTGKYVEFIGGDFCKDT